MPLLSLVSCGKNGAPGEIRTPDPLIRSQVLYPAELRAPVGTRGEDLCVDPVFIQVEVNECQLSLRRAAETYRKLRSRFVPRLNVQ